MAVELDGKSYVVNTPLDNAYNMLNAINEALVTADVKNKDGEFVQFKINLTSPMWLLCLGVGFIATVCQKIMFAVGCSFSIAECSDQQVLNLSQIARLKRKQGAYSVINIIATASEDGDCTITTDLEAKATYNSKDYTFKPVYDTTIEAGKSEKISLVCTEIGPVYVGVNGITEFTTEVENLESMSSEASQPGAEVESISSLRARLQSNNSLIPFEAAIASISALTGVIKCNIYFNSNYSASLPIAGYNVPPRHSLLIVQGYSDKIAETYLAYMMAQTTKDDNVGTVPSTQEYTFTNGQTFPVHFYPPAVVPMMIRVSVSGQQIDARTSQLIKEAIASVSNTKNIGENYSEAYILSAINAGVRFPTITGCRISTDGINWGSITNLNEAQLGVILIDNIDVQIGGN